jgi:hypothetical protein
MAYDKCTDLENRPKIPKSLNTSFISGLHSTLKQVNESAQCKDTASVATASQHMVLSDDLANIFIWPKGKSGM